MMQVLLACSIILLWPESNISSSASYSYLWILPDHNADISASLLISYCSFSSLIFMSIPIIRLKILTQGYLTQEGTQLSKKNVVLLCLFLKKSESP